ncbi:TolC family protein [Flavicella sp.]|uniref:TolC family protein n=1 Tax=Flavicella sp. TaxID=2957742 RepID=UPI00301B59BA
MKKLLFIGISLCCFTTFAQKVWSLKDCVNYAIENNISIKQSALNLETAEISRRGAIGNFLPNLNSSLAHSWNTGLNPDPSTNLNVTSTTQTSSLGISSNITLYDGLRNIRQLHRSNLDILANQYELEDMKDNISLNIINAYLQVAFNKESLTTVKRQYVINQAELERSTQLQEAGVIPKGDLLELEATLANQEQIIISSSNLVRISKINLANILTIVDYNSFNITDTIAVTSSSILEKSAEQIYNKALETRNDIKNFEIAVEMSKDDLKLSKGVYHPTLSAGYSFNTSYFQSELYQSPEFSDQIHDRTSHSFGLNLSIPVFNRLTNSNNVRQSKINLKKNTLALEQTKIDLKSKVNQSYTDVVSAYAVFQASEKALLARKESFRYSKEKFDLGLMNSFDYSLARLSFENAENDVIKSKYDYFFKARVLEFYFGISLR